MVQEQPEQATAEENGAKKSENARGLLLVGLFKLSKALFFTAVGVGALHLVHADFGKLVQHVVDSLPIDPEGRFVNMITDRADAIGHHQLRQAGFLSIGYAVLCLVEGVGLMTRQVWAEFLTVILTTAGLPWETYELVQRFTWMKVGVTSLNLLILLYLLWVLKKKRVMERVGR